MPIPTTHIRVVEAILIEPEQAVLLDELVEAGEANPTNEDVDTNATVVTADTMESVVSAKRPSSITRFCPAACRTWVGKKKPQNG